MCNVASTYLFTPRDNPEYKANASRLADLFLASRHHPLDDAAWLMEFVATTRGANHLKLASRNLGLFELCSLDVALSAILVAFLASKLALNVAVMCRRRLHQSKEITDRMERKKML